MKMNRTILTAGALWGALLLAATQPARAEEGVPRMIKGALSEKYSEKLVKIKGEPGDPPDYETVHRHKIVAAAKINLNGAVDVASFTPETPVHVGVGNFDFSATLGDDPKYVPGKSKKVSFSIPDPNDEAGGRKVGKITVTWTPEAATVSLKSTDPDADGAISDYLGLADTKGHPIKFTGNSGISLGLGEDAEAFGTLILSGKSAFTEKTKRIDGEANPFPLNSATLVGKLDSKPPVLQTPIPSTVDDTLVDLELVYLDNELSLLADFSVSVNGQTQDIFDEAQIGIDDDFDNPGRTTVEITALRLEPGANTVIFTASDSTGNVSVVKKTITAPSF